MSINWNIFKNNVRSAFERYKSRTSKNDQLTNVAKIIAGEYETAMFGGSEQYGNAVATYNRIGLEQNIEQAFRTGFNIRSGMSAVFGNYFSLGVIQFWTGAQLQTLVPPPGTVGATSNSVLNPGTVIPTLQLSNTKNRDQFIVNMINFFQQHLQTVGGTTIGLIPQPTGPPIPTPFPWVGYS